MSSLLRFQSGATNISQAATTIAHGLPGTPTEYRATLRTGPTGAYFLGVSSTNVVLAAGGIGQVSADVQCAVNHSLVK